MKITDTAPVRSAQTLRRKVGTSNAGTADFSEYLTAADTSSAAEALPVSDVANIASLDGMLTLQAVSEEELKRKEEIKHGHSMLQSLENLRASLLAGRIPPEVIRELDVRLARQRAQVSDPKLLEILDDIELRVAVEKAKLERALQERDLLL